MAYLYIIYITFPRIKHLVCLVQKANSLYYSFGICPGVFFFLCSHAPLVIYHSQQGSWCKLFFFAFCLCSACDLHSGITVEGCSNAVVEELALLPFSTETLKFDWPGAQRSKVTAFCYFHFISVAVAYFSQDIKCIENDSFALQMNKSLWKTCLRMMLILLGSEDQCASLLGFWAAESERSGEPPSSRTRFDTARTAQEPLGCQLPLLPTPTTTAGLRYCFLTTP